MADLSNNPSYYTVGRQKGSYAVQLVTAIEGTKTLRTTLERVNNRDLAISRAKKMAGATGLKFKPPRIR